MIGLSNEYEHSIAFPIKLESIPGDLLYEGSSKQEITIYLKAKGFLLLRKIYLQKPEIIQLDISKFNLQRKDKLWTVSIPSKNLIQPVKTQLNKSMEIKSILPDTLVLNFIKARKKFIPVRPELTLQFRDQYMLYGEYTVIPDKIMITGKDKNILPYNEITTLPKRIDNISRNTEIYLKILKPDDVLTISPESVMVRIPVEKYTESEISVPLEIRNSGNRDIKIYPENVTISYLIALKDFEKLKPSSLKAYVELSPGKNKLKVEMESSPAFIRILKVYPEEVEYIIVKK